GSEGHDEAQPFYVNSPYGIALAHNGNLINTDELRREIFETDRRNVNTESDSEVLLNVFAHELDSHRTLTPEAALNAVERVHRRARGGCAPAAPVLGLGLLDCRPRNAIRLLLLGNRETEHASDYAGASESVALGILDFEPLRDVEPGEGIVISSSGVLQQ